MPPQLITLLLTSLSSVFAARVLLTAAILIAVVCRHYCLSPLFEAYIGRMRPDDVIIQLGLEIVSSLVKLFETLWEKAGESVEVVVKRASSDENNLKLIMVVEETGSEFR
ncbi:hypothetical protein Ancab_001226 [Ancistrocladus abbreviatus]